MRECFVEEEDYQGLPYVQPPCSHLEKDTEVSTVIIQTMEQLLPQAVGLLNLSLLPHCYCFLLQM